MLSLYITKTANGSKEPFLERVTSPAKQSGKWINDIGLGLIKKITEKKGMEEVSWVVVKTV